MLSSLLIVISIVSGLASSGAWLYASQVKVSREKALSQRRAEAQKKGVTPDLSGVVFDGWEVRETLAAQAKWNSIGAVFAAIAISCQAVMLAISHV